MSPPRPVGPDRVAEFDTLIDARSPSEFADDHLPGAINCPVLDDDERRIVGTLYKQQGAFEARRVGGAMVAARLAQHLREQFADRPAGWRPLVYCWRGGLRSGSMVSWLRLVGWDAQQLAGGYKSYRRWVMQQLELLVPPLRLQVLCGPTGSAKTRLLLELARQGAQVIDLEGLAGHKGSVLGQIPGQHQPSQKQFENRLVQQLRQLDMTQPVFIEAESRKIGQLALPTGLLLRLRASPCLEIVAPADARLAYLLRDYAWLGDDRPRLAALVGPSGPFKGLHANHTLAQWASWASQGALAPLFAALMAQHYDPRYARSQQGDFLQLRQAVQLDAPSLAEADLPGLAAQLRQAAWVKANSDSHWA